MPQQWARRLGSGRALVRAAVVVTALVVGIGFVQPASVDASSSSISAANAVLHLSLPWGAGDTWRLTGGPHSNTGSGRPWSALDFAGPVAGNSYPVRAAAAGSVTRPCANMVEIRHVDGWTTSYYHLTRIQVNSGQHVRTGQLLGYTSMQAGCGGSATGPHVHFALSHKGTYVNIDGLEIGGWTVHDGSSQYTGCLVRSKERRCAPSGQVYNFGP
jgi:LasA protease